MTSGGSATFRAAGRAAGRGAAPTPLLSLLDVHARGAGATGASEEACAADARFRTETAVALVAKRDAAACHRCAMAGGEGGRQCHCEGDDFKS